MEDLFNFEVCSVSNLQATNGGLFFSPLGHHHSLSEALSDIVERLTLYAAAVVVVVAD